MKAARPVRRGADGKVLRATGVTRRRPTLHRGDLLICPQGKALRRSALQRRDRAYQYVAHQKDCQSCPVKAGCLPPNQKRRYVALSMYHPLLLQAQELKKTAAYRRERKWRLAIAEGTFASLDRLGWAQSRLRGLWKVDCEGYGGSDLQRAEAGAHIGPTCWTIWPGVV